LSPSSPLAEGPGLYAAVFHESRRKGGSCARAFDDPRYLSDRRLLDRPWFQTTDACPSHENQQGFETAAVQAGDYCRENFGNTAHTSDKCMGVAGDATFACSP
jgi:hypothetical protein